VTTHVQILIVEDDAPTLDTYARSLMLYGYDVRTALSGEMAWQEAEAHCPDAMIVDWKLPGMDGLALVLGWMVLRACDDCAPANTRDTFPSRS
jgi:two-component system, OmpR family, response regulator